MEEGLRLEGGRVEVEIIIDELSDIENGHGKCNKSFWRGKINISGWSRGGEEISCLPD